MSLSLRDRNELGEMGKDPVFVALHHAPNEAERLMKAFEFGGYSFAFIDSILARIPAEKALALADHELVTDLEIIDDGIAARVNDLRLVVPAPRNVVNDLLHLSDGVDRIPLSRLLALWPRRDWD